MLKILERYYFDTKCMEKWFQKEIVELSEFNELYLLTEKK